MKIGTIITPCYVLQHNVIPAQNCHTFITLIPYNHYTHYSTLFNFIRVDIHLVVLYTVATAMSYLFYLLLKTTLPKYKHRVVRDKQTLNGIKNSAPRQSKGQASWLQSCYCLSISHLFISFICLIGNAKNCFTPKFCGYAWSLQLLCAKFQSGCVYKMMLLVCRFLFSSA